MSSNNLNGRFKYTDTHTHPMVREIRLTFEDEEFYELEKQKDSLDMSWRDFILYLAGINKKGNIER